MEGAMSGQFVIGVVGYVVAVNLLAYAAMAFDKARARNNLRRIPESTLLNLAMVGGSLGTVIAQQTIRHKTHKEPFRSTLHVILTLQLFALIALAVGSLVTGSPAALWQFLVSMT
jgi:uncharacterized membrane protein YsdA (DUF1294 family)